MTQRIHARHYATGEQLETVVNHGRIAYIGPPTDARAELVADWIAPSFFDLQVNGSHGVSFNSATLTVAEVRRVANMCRSHGVGAFCPTLITASTEALTHGFATLASACLRGSKFGKMMPAFHLEGPYIAAEDGPRGAHPRAYVRPPDWDEFRRWQDAAEGRIRLVTLAPETDGALDFIALLTASGVVAAIGHTAASPVRIHEAIAAGARLSTHLGNGTHVLMRRHPNYVWEQLASDEIWASVIADGHHIPDSVLKCLLRVKTPARTALISDASSLAGMPPGRYQMWEGQLEVLAEGKVVVPNTGLLAGSAVFLDSCVSHVLRLGLADLHEAIEMTSIRPRELLGLPVPRLEIGAAADVVVFDWQPGQDLQVKAVIK